MSSSASHTVFQATRNSALTSRGHTFAESYVILAMPKGS